MKAKHYWLMSDEKTVREISFEKYADIFNNQWKRDAHTSLIARVSKTEVMVRKGRKWIYIPRKQLEQILK